MGQDPDVIRREIEQTREHMGETVEALGYKADVPARAKEAVGEKVGAVGQKVSSLKDAITGGAERVNEATPGKEDITGGARRAKGMAQENPMGLAIGAAAVGFLVGLMLPETRVENEKLGEMGDTLKSTARELGHEAVEHGKQIASEAAGSAMEAGKEHAQELASSAQEHVHETGDQLKQAAPTGSSAPTGTGPTVI